MRILFALLLTTVAPASSNADPTSWEDVPVEAIAVAILDSSDIRDANARVREIVPQFKGVGWALPVLLDALANDHAVDVIWPALCKLARGGNLNYSPALGPHYWGVLEMQHLSLVERYAAGDHCARVIMDRGFDWAKNPELDCEALFTFSPVAESVFAALEDAATVELEEARRRGDSNVAPRMRHLANDARGLRRWAVNILEARCREP